MNLWIAVLIIVCTALGYAAGKAVADGKHEPSYAALCNDRDAAVDYSIELWARLGEQARATRKSMDQEILTRRKLINLRQVAAAAVVDLRTNVDMSVKKRREAMVGASERLTEAANIEVAEECPQGA